MPSLARGHGPVYIDKTGVQNAPGPWEAAQETARGVLSELGRKVNLGEAEPVSKQEALRLIEERITPSIIGTSGGLSQQATKLLAGIRSLQRSGQARDLIPIPKLRKAASLPEQEFDAALSELAQSRAVALHPHDMPFGLSAAERSQLFSVPDALNTLHRGRTYYIGVVPK